MSDLICRKKDETFYFDHSEGELAVTFRLHMHLTVAGQLLGMTALKVEVRRGDDLLYSGVPQGSKHCIIEAEEWAAEALEMISEFPG